MRVVKKKKSLPHGPVSTGKTFTWPLMLTFREKYIRNSGKIRVLPWQWIQKPVKCWLYCPCQVMIITSSSAACPSPSGMNWAMTKTPPCRTVLKQYGVPALPWNPSRQPSGWTQEPCQRQKNWARAAWAGRKMKAGETTRWRPSTQHQALWWKKPLYTLITCTLPKRPCRLARTTLQNNWKNWDLAKNLPLTSDCQLPSTATVMDLTAKYSWLIPATGRDRCW